MTNNITLSKEIWYELVGYIDATDRQDAADALMSLLIDHDVAPTEIREAFKNDEWMSDSVTSYLKDDQRSEDEYDEWNEDDDFSDEINEDY